MTRSGRRLDGYADYAGRRSGAVVAALVMIGLAVAVSIGPGPGSAASAQVAPGLDQRIQILSAAPAPGADPDLDRGVVLEVAVPAAIGLLGPDTTDFAVADGGQLVDLSVEAVDDPAQVVVVLDTSGSLDGRPLAVARAAAARFIDGLPVDIRVGLVSFGETVTVHRAPTLDRAGLLDDLVDIEDASGETALWDALVAAADVLDPPEDERPGQATVVVLSDGEDTVSNADRAAAVERLQSAAASLHALAIEGQEADFAALEATANEVGGQYLATDELDRVGDLYADIASRLTNRYRLRFDLAGDGVRQVVVSVAIDGAVASARSAIDGPSGAAVDRPAEEAGGSASTAPPPTRPSDPVVDAGPGLLADPRLLPGGLAAIFTSLFLLGLVAARAPSQIRLEAASGADRLVGLHTRFGQSIDRLLTRHRVGRWFDLQLDAANISLRAGEFLLGWLVVTTSLALLLAAFGRPLVAVVVIAVLVVATALVLRTRADRRRTQFADQLTDTLTIMASSLRAGQSLPRTVELVATEAPAPTAPEFHRIAFEVRVGRDLTDSMRDTATRLQSPDLEWMAQAIDINRELGGDLTHVLDNVATTIRERRTVARQIEAMSAEGRATGWMLEAMPIGLFLLSWWRTPEHTDRLINDPTGRLLLGIAVTGMVVGHLWIRRLIRLRF